jgi:hypothetical protein
MTPVNYAKEMERKKKIFMTENIEEENEMVPKKGKEVGKFIAQRNTRYDNNLTDSSQVPELTSKIRKLQGMNLIKSNSMKKLKHLDTNQVIEDCDVEMTNYQNLTIEENETSSNGDKTVSAILQNKINEFMTTKTDSSYSRRFPRPTNDTTLGSIMDVTVDGGRGRFLTQINKKNNKLNLGNYQMIQNQFRTNTPSQVENVGNSQYLRTVVQRGDTIGGNWETKIEEEGVEMGEIMIDESGKIKGEDKSYFENQVDKLKEEQKLNDLEFEKAKQNPNNDLLKEDLSEEVNKSIKSDLFEDTPKKRETSKSPELLVIENDAPVKKRTFRLGRSRKKTPKKNKKEGEENKSFSNQNETAKSSNRVSQQTKNLDIEMPQDIPKAIEIDLGFNSKFEGLILIKSEF